jgi:5'-nucleotidase / UDP-sugar diphosphatase
MSISLTLRLPLVIGALGLMLAAAAPAAAERVILAHVNDLDRFETKDGKGGYGRLAAVLAELRAGEVPVIATNGGDMISPSLLSGLDQGAHIVALNNAVGLDIAVLGNHEFDFGPEVLLERIAEADYLWVSSNVTLDGLPFPGTLATTTVEVGDFTLGFLGLTTPETAEISSAGERVAFADPVAAAARAVAELEAAGADVVVAITHLKLSEDRAVAEVEGIDVILGGHDHEPMTLLLGDTLIHKSGSQAEYVGVIELDLARIEGAAGPEVVVTPAWRMIATALALPEPEVEAVVEGYLAQLDEELAQPIGTIAATLDSRRLEVRSKEASFGNLVADALRAATGAEVAITNGGGIRGDKLYEAGSVLTRADILAELPFGNRTVLLELAGGDILAALENGLGQVEEGAGRFPQVSGMSVIWNPKAPAGSRVEEVRVGEAHLDPAATYRLATNEFMAKGGDGYTMFAPALIDPNAGTLMANDVIAFIERAGTIAPAIEGRIREARP